MQDVVLGFRLLRQSNSRSGGGEGAGANAPDGCDEEGDAEEAEARRDG